MKRLVRRAELNLDDPKFAEIKALIDENNRLYSAVKNTREIFYDWENRSGIFDTMRQMTKEQLQMFVKMLSSSTLSMSAYERLRKDTEYGDEIDIDISALATKFNENIEAYNEALRIFITWRHENEHKFGDLIRDKGFTQHELWELERMVESGMPTEIGSIAAEMKRAEHDQWEKERQDRQNEKYRKEIERRKKK